MCVLFTLIKTNEIYQLMSLYRKNESINIINMTCDEYILICANQMLENWMSFAAHPPISSYITCTGYSTPDRLYPEQEIIISLKWQDQGHIFKISFTPILVFTVLKERTLWINSTHFSRAPPVDHLRSAVPPIHRNQPATQFVPLGQAIHRQTVQTWHGRLSSVACSWLQATVNR